MHTLYLCMDSDTAYLLDAAERALSMGADPNAPMYTFKDVSTEEPFYTSYEFALFLSWHIFPGQQLDGLLSALNEKGGLVQASTMERWDPAIRMHVESKGAAVETHSSVQ